jgi:hypothetical protein
VWHPEVESIAPRTQPRLPPPGATTLFLNHPVSVAVAVLQFATSADVEPSNRSRFRQAAWTNKVMADAHAAQLAAAVVDDTPIPAPVAGGGHRATAGGTGTTPARVNQAGGPWSNRHLSRGGPRPHPDGARGPW